MLKEGKKISLDKIDHELIDVLVRNARAPSNVITDTLNKRKIVISDRAVRKRITRLEKSGVIKRYHAQVDFEKVGLPFPRVIFVKFKAADNFREKSHAFIRAITNSEFVSHVAYVLGEYNIVFMAHYPSREVATSENVALQDEFHAVIGEYLAFDCQTIKQSMIGHRITPLGKKGI